MQNKSIPIFLSSDDNYSPLISTTIISICKNTKSFCEFYVLDGGIILENQKKILGIKDKYNNFSIEFIKIDTEKYFKDFITNGYITVPTYYRFIIPILFPQISKAIYLDVDIIAKGDITYLYDVDLENYTLGAVQDVGNEQYIQMSKRNIAMKESSIYFNAGVLLIDFKKWRKGNITEKLFEIEKKYRGHLLCNDQDVLNCYFEDNYKLLDTKYNSSVDEDCILRHYYGQAKPWIFKVDNSNELSKFNTFFEIAEESPFYEVFMSKCANKSVHYLHLIKLLAKNRNIIK